MSSGLWSRLTGCCMPNDISGKLDDIVAKLDAIDAKLSSGVSLGKDSSAGVVGGSGTRVSMNEVWKRIKLHAGEEFYTTRGLPFTYEIKGKFLHPSRTNFAISYANFEKALVFVPLKNTVTVKSVPGPSYVYAILMDQRIRQNDW